MKKLSIPYYILLLVSIILFTVSNFINPYSFSYLAALIFIILLASFIFCTGLIMNKQDFYRKNITKYIILYFILLLSLTMFINRSGISLLNKEFLENYKVMINIIPLKTIIHYLTGPVNISIKITNILGNLIAFIPLSFLLMLKDKKYYQVKAQFIYLSITVLIIELLQLITSTGRFDIDDFILNVGGSLLFVIIMNRMKLIEKLKNLFYQDFHIPKIGKWIVECFLFVFIILIDIMILINMLTVKQLITQMFYVEEKSSCSKLEKIEFDKYNLYLDCIDVTYETKNHYQISLSEAFKTKEITRKDIKEKLSKKETIPSTATIYTNTEENITFILCQTSEGNKDIYVGNKTMQYNENFCK